LILIIKMRMKTLYSNEQQYKDSKMMSVTSLSPDSVKIVDGTKYRHSLSSGKMNSKKQDDEVV
jgi:hypothetical protein